MNHKKSPEFTDAVHSLLRRPERTPVLLVFGGSFDPIHKGHLSVAREIMERKLANEILFIPAGRPPHKAGAKLASKEDRLAMLELALNGQPKFGISDIELNREDAPSYTIDTLDTLRQAMPEYEIRFLIGMDSLVDLHKWHRVGELITRFQVMVYPRFGVERPVFSTLVKHFGTHNAQKLLNSILRDFPEFPESSSEIRERCVRGERFEGMCPDEVEQYIYEHGLYGAKKEDFR